MSYEERLMVLKQPMPQQRRLFSSLAECYKTINSLIDQILQIFTFARDFRPLGASHCFKLKSVSATLNRLFMFYFLQFIILLICIFMLLLLYFFWGGGGIALDRVNFFISFSFVDKQSLLLLLLLLLLSLSLLIISISSSFM